MEASLLFDGFSEIDFFFGTRAGGGKFKKKESLRRFAERITKVKKLESLPLIVFSLKNQSFGGWKLSGCSLRFEVTRELFKYDSRFSRRKL